MPSRQFHTESRLGCASCKQRRIKCGEERPECNNCVKSGWECSFVQSDASGGLVLGHDPTPSAALERNLQRSLDTYDFDTLPGLEQYDAELVQHYASSTCFTITNRESVGPSWQLTIPSLTQLHPFLRHGLLSLAAMHLRYSCSPELRPWYFELANQHQCKALHDYIPQLDSINEQNYNAMFAYSIMLAPLRYSTLVVADESSEPQSFITEMINNFDCLIGSTIISSRHDTWLRNGILSPMITVRELENIIPRLTEGPRLALECLMGDISHTMATEQSGSASSSDQVRDTERRLAAYRRSIDVLSNAFPFKDGSPVYHDVIISWPYFAGADFLNLLKENDSIALVILGFYGVALHALTHVWWLDGLGRRLIKAVSHVVSPKNYSLLRWPYAKMSSS